METYITYLSCLVYCLGFRWTRILALWKSWRQWCNIFIHITLIWLDFWCIYRFLCHLFIQLFYCGHLASLEDFIKQERSFKKHFERESWRFNFWSKRLKIQQLLCVIWGAKSLILRQRTCFFAIGLVTNTSSNKCSRTHRC